MGATLHPPERHALIHLEGVRRPFARKSVPCSFSEREGPGHGRAENDFLLKRAVIKFVFWLSRDGTPSFRRDLLDPVLPWPPDPPGPELPFLKTIRFEEARSDGVIALGPKDVAEEAEAG